MKRNSRLLHSSLIITVLLAGLLLFLALRGADWPQTWKTIQHAHAGGLVASFMALSISYFIRGLRWRVLLEAEHPVPSFTAFWATSVGYLGNNFLPARAGELIRAVAISRKTAVTMGFALATALTERIVDAVALVLIGLVAILTLKNVPDWLSRTTQGMAILCVLGIGCLIALPRVEPLVRRVVGVLPLPSRWLPKITAGVYHFLAGIRVLGDMQRAGRFLGFTVAIWLIDAIAAQFVAHALDLSMSLSQALILLVGLGLSSAAPSTPGYVGVYQFVAVTVLMPLGFTRNAALAFIVTFQGVTYATVIVFGLLGLWRLHRMPDARPIAQPERLAPSSLSGRNLSEAGLEG